MVEKLYTTGEVAKYLNVEKETVLVWLRSKKMKGSRMSQSKLWRVSESQLKEFLEATSNVRS